MPSSTKIYAPTIIYAPPVMTQWQECSKNQCVQYQAWIKDGKLASLKQQVGVTQGMQANLPLGHVTLDRRLVLHYMT